MIGVKFNVEELRMPWEICSVTETKIENIVKKIGFNALIDYHKAIFTRVYPKGMRTDSSNYNPALSWCAGA